MTLFIVSCPGRSAARSTCGAVRCRAGVVTSAGVWYGPGSAERHEECRTASGTPVSPLPIALHRRFKLLTKIRQFIGAEIDYSSKWTVYACVVYFWARVAHLIVYTLGLPVFRTLAFTVGFFAQVVLALAILKIV